jgi:predicted metal-dependent hydrolase
MKEIILNDKIVKYELSFKKNKNTYFYFKKEGYIKINASRYQREKVIIKHMKDHASIFLKKLEKAQTKNRTNDPNSYFLWGKKLTRTTSNDTSVIMLHDDVVLEPVIPVDQLNKLYRELEAKLLLEEARLLMEKYQNNQFVSIDNITIRTRYTTSRFGSCNSVKRNINLNTYLVHYDKQYLEYVFLHEICHLTHQNHGKEFYQLLQDICPKYKALRQELRMQFRN